MKVGDLVRLLDEPEVHRNNEEIPPDALGIVVEPGPLISHLGDAWKSVWVQWNGRWDWDSMYIEDLEIISASR